jgi:hypothetical protein
MTIIISRKARRHVGAICLSLLGLVSCTTYHAAGPSGGFSETRLSTTSFQVHFRGNGYASPARVEKFMLRRAAELALENGFRYFVLDAPKNLDRRDFWQQYSERGVTVRFAAEESNETADAVIVIEDTNELANNRLSTKATEQLKRFKSQ